MTKLYTLELSGLLQRKWTALLDLLPPDRRLRALSCRNEVDSARITGAGWLLQTALEEHGIPKDAQVFETDFHGKPRLSGRNDIHFSLSHSGTWAVCAVADHPVGVDVELPRCTMAVARRHFTPGELAELDRLDEASRPESLNRLWTAREAFLKALGVGLAVPLSRFSVTLSADGARLNQSLSPLPYLLHEYRAGSSCICLCTTDPRPEPIALHIEKTS